MKKYISLFLAVFILVFIFSFPISAVYVNDNSKIFTFGDLAKVYVKGHNISGSTNNYEKFVEQVRCKWMDVGQTLKNAQVFHAVVFYMVGIDDSLISTSDIIFFDDIVKNAFGDHYYQMIEKFSFCFEPVNPDLYVIGFSKLFVDVYKECYDYFLDYMGIDSKKFVFPLISCDLNKENWYSYDSSYKVSRTIKFGSLYNKIDDIHFELIKSYDLSLEQQKVDSIFVSLKNSLNMGQYVSWLPNTLGGVIVTYFGILFALGSCLVGFKILHG